MLKKKVYAEKKRNCIEKKETLHVKIYIYLFCMKQDYSAWGSIVSEREESSWRYAQSLRQFVATPLIPKPALSSYTTHELPGALTLRAAPI